MTPEGKKGLRDLEAMVARAKKLSALRLEAAHMRLSIAEAEAEMMESAFALLEESIKGMVRG